MSQTYSSQNSLLLTNLMHYYNSNDNLERMLRIINGDVNISLRIVDWFTTNYAKKHYTVYNIETNYAAIENDMTSRNSTSKRKLVSGAKNATRKVREELSISASKTIKKEEVEIVIKFD